MNVHTNCWNDRKTRSKTCWKSCGRRTQGCQGVQPEALCKAEITQGCIIYIDSELLLSKNQETRIHLISTFSTGYEPGKLLSVLLRTSFIVLHQTQLPSTCLRTSVPQKLIGASMAMLQSSTPRITMLGVLLLCTSYELHKPGELL